MSRTSLAHSYLLLAGVLLACAPATEAESPTASAETAETKPSASPSAPATTDPAITEAVNATDRSPDDRALDAGRHPIDLLSFFGVHAGQRVAELAAGGGYTTELLARVVGPSGVVYGQNNAFVLERFAEKPWTERLTKPVMQNVKRIDSEFDAPLPGIDNLDLVINVLFYHDTVWLKTDRAAMNRAVFAALAPGGIYGIVDHSSKAGAGVTETEALHRIEQSVVQSEIEAVGFVLVKSGDFLSVPADTRDWNASPRAAGDKRGQSDRFVLAFVKPNKGVR